MHETLSQNWGFCFSRVRTFVFVGDSFASFYPLLNFTIRAMKLTRKIVLPMTLSCVGVIIITSLASCSMYKNAGRNNFESNTPGQVHSFSLKSTKDSATTTMSTSDSKTCWQQPANEALWFDTMTEGNEDVSLTVRKINSDEIEACVVDSED